MGATPTLDSTSFGALPPSPPNLPPARAMRKAQSDYNPRGAGMARQGHQVRYSASGAQSTVSPHHLSPQLPSVPSVLSVQDAGETETGDGRRKHQCPNCFRAFARPFNLKTHMDTHKSDRLKPYVCPLLSCGRSFSRKHDLQRHRVSIHRPELSMASLSKQPMGVERGNRVRCDDCGKSWFGRERGCGCLDIK